MRNGCGIFIAIIPLLGIIIGCNERTLPPEVVVLSDPEDGVVLNESRIYLDWEKFDNSNGYRVLVWRAGYPDSILWDRIEFDSSVKTTFVITNGEYRWCVGVRIGDCDFENWSDTSSFIIAQSPFRIISWSETPGTARDVTMSYNYAYVADCMSGLTVVDANDIENLTTIDTYDWDQQDEMRSIFSDSISNTLMVADYRGAPNIKVFSISDPANPAALGYADWLRRCEDVTGLWMRDTLFVLAADYDDGIAILDMGTYGFLNGRGSTYDPGYCNGVVGWDTLAAAAADDAGIFIFSIAVPEMMATNGPIGLCDTPGQAEEMVYYNGYLYVADGLSGLAAIDVSDPENPEAIYQSDTQVGDAQGIAVGSFGGKDYLALAIGSDGIILYDLANPAAPVPLNRLETMYAYGVGVDSRGFYVADRDWGVVAVQIE